MFPRALAKINFQIPHPYSLRPTTLQLSNKKVEEWISAKYHRIPGFQRRNYLAPLLVFRRPKGHLINVLPHTPLRESWPETTIKKTKTNAANTFLCIYVYVYTYIHADLPQHAPPSCPRYPLSRPKRWCASAIVTPASKGNPASLGRSQSRKKERTGR